MNVTRNTDGTFNLNGITELEAFSLLALTGNVYGGFETTDNAFSALSPLFPEYVKGVYANHAIVYPCRINLNKNELEAAFQKCRNTKPVAQKPVSTQRRDASGRFEKKVWVARFYYPDSSKPSYHTSNLVYRTLITNLTGKRKPAFYSDSIDGIDLTRGAFRRFSLSKIKGGQNAIRWTKEYKSDVV